MFHAYGNIQKLGLPTNMSPAAVLAAEAADDAADVAMSRTSELPPRAKTRPPAPAPEMAPILAASGHSIDLLRV